MIRTIGTYGVAKQILSTRGRETRLIIKGGALAPTIFLPSKYYFYMYRDVNHIVFIRAVEEEDLVSIVTPTRQSVS